MSLVAKNAIYALSLQPGSVSYLTEQTGPMVRDILLPAIKQIVPSEFYALKTIGASSYDIEWTSKSVTRCRTRQAKNTVEDPPFRGPSAGWIGHDEAALDKQGKRMMQISEGMLRGRDLLCVDCVSTPKLGWLYDYVNGLGLAQPGIDEQVSADGVSAAFYGRTSDNAYNNDLDERLRGTYSPEFAAQELDAQWVSLTGRIWQNFDTEHIWPAGNVWPGGYRPDLPYILSVDLGVRSAWLIWQRIDALDEWGHRTQRTPVDVVMAEYTPTHGNALDMIAAIDAKYGRPASIVVGMDVKTPASTDGTKPALLFNRKWPGCPLRVPSGFLADKEIQHMRAQSRMLNSFGQRRTCIAQDFVSHDADTGRGFRQMISLDSWPDGVPAVGSFFEKDKKSGGVGIEDVRDAMLYYLICMHPPEARRERKAI